MNQAYKPQPNTTLNEKYNILLEYEVPSTSFPTIGWYGIGTGGLNVINGDNGYKYSKHSPVDAALFNQIPFLMVELDNDISAADRENYRIRTEEVFNEVTYACYYLKKIPEFDLRDYFYKILSVDDRDELSVFSTDTDKLLNPVPVTRSVDVLDVDSSTYVTKLAKLTFSLTNAEIKSITEVMSLRGLSETTIAEIAICMGVEATGLTYPELVNTQIAIHVEVDLDLSAHIINSTSIKRAIELGGTEPLLV
jgi:hypothetical protein